MEISKGAAGNLINRYRAVLKKCSLLNVFGTLAVAGMLLGGGVAQAAAAEWGPDKDVVISADETLGTNRTAKSLTINESVTLTNSGGSIVLTEGSGQLLNIKGILVSSNGVGLQGITAAGKYYGSGVISGAVNLTDGSSISLDSITINKGSHSLAGAFAGDGPHPTKGAWRKGSMIYAGHDLTIAGDAPITVSLGNNGLLGVGSSLSAAGQVLTIGKNATVSMTGAAVGTASVIRTFKDATLVIKDGGKVAVGSSGVGVIASNNVTLAGNGSSITVATGGKLEMTDVLPDTEDANATAVSAVGLTFSNGNLTLKDGARIAAQAATFKKGVLNIDGMAAGGVRSGVYGADGVVESPNLTLGTDANNTLSVNVTNGGGLEAVEATIKAGATVNVSGQAASQLNSAQAMWLHGSTVFGDTSLDIESGATVNVGANGILATGAYASGGSASAGIEVKGVVNMNGAKGAEAKLIAYGASMTSADTAGKLTIGGGTSGTVNVNGYGRIVGDAGKLVVDSKGTLNVNQGGHLLVSTGYVPSATPPDKKLRDLAGTFNDAYALQIYNTALDVKTGGALNVKGDALIADDGTAAGAGNGKLALDGTGKATIDGNLTIGGSWTNKANGQVTFGGGTSELIVTGNLDGTRGELDLSNGGKLTVGGTYKNRGTTGSGGTTTLALSVDDVRASLGAIDIHKRDGTTATAIEISDSVVNITGLAGDRAFYKVDGVAATAANSALGVSGGGLTLSGIGGDYAGQTTVSGTGKMLVTAGNWTLDKLNVQAGHAEVTGGKLTIGTELKSSAVGNGTTTGVNVKSGGVLSGDKGIFLNAANTAIKDNTVQQIHLDAASTLELNFDAGTSLDKSQRDAIRGALLNSGSSGNAGLISYNGATLTYEKNATEGLKDTVDISNATGTLAKGETIGATGTTNAGETTTTVNATVGADKLAVLGTGAATAATVTVGGGALTLIGEGGALVDVRNTDGTHNAAASANTTIAVAGNTLNLGNQAAGAGSGSLKEVSVAGGAVNVANGSYKLGTLDTSAVGNAKVNVGAAGALVLDSLKAGSGDVINVGNAGGAGHLSVANASLDGATVFLDPPFIKAGDTSNASTGALTFNGSKIDGTLIVGQNSMLSVGTADATWLREQVNLLQQTGQLTWGTDVTAALALKGNQTLDATKGGIFVDGSKTHAAQPVVTPDTATFADKSLTVVDGVSMGTGAALTAGAATSGKATISNGSKLAIANGHVGKTYTILSGFEDTSGTNVGILGDGGTGIYNAATDTGWNGSNLLSTAFVQHVVQANTGSDLADGKFSVKVQNRSASDVIPYISGGMASMVDSLYGLGLNDTDSANAGVMFVSRGTDKRYMDLNSAANVLESAAQTALLGAAPQVGADAVAAVSGAVGNHLSLNAADTGVSSGSADLSTFAVWAAPLYQNNRTSGLKSGSFSYGADSNLYGGLIGFDYGQELFRLGLALSIGGGDSKSRGSMARTKNDFDFWGATVYASYRPMTNLNLIADLGFTRIENDIKQDLASSLGMGSELKSKVDASLYTVGLTGEYLFALPVLDITPHIGLRYTGYRQDRYNVTANAGDVFNVDKAEMDTFTLPLGVRFSRTFETAGGWKVAPQLDLTYIPAMGDVKMDTTAHIPGVAVTGASLTGEVFDRHTGEARVALGVAKGNVAFDLGYTFQGSTNRTAHGVNAMLKYNF